MSELIRVLFVCVHNSARSQMAEAFLRRHGGARFTVESAGFEPREIQPLVVEAMKQVGIDLSGARSQAVFDLYRAGRIYDYVISVCDEAHGERCPVFPGFAKRLHWSFADPGAFEGTTDERLAGTVAVRDEIDSQVQTRLKELSRRDGP
jgi:arsenate reductase